MEHPDTEGMSLVATERAHHFELGYDRDHDDRHGLEELAAAAAFYLLPESMNQDVCISPEEGQLEVMPLFGLVEMAAWGGLHRDSTEDTAIRDDVCLDTRINQVVKGVSLGLAELERLLRLRAARRPF